MKIICIGRNYRAHAAELHHDTGLAESGAEPVWFMKPDTALLRNNDPFYIPHFSQEVHYECELVVRINRVGRAISERFAHRYYDEVGLGIDFTARDLQSTSRPATSSGRPLPKGSPGSARRPSTTRRPSRRSSSRWPGWAATCRNSVSHSTSTESAVRRAMPPK